MGSAFCHIVMQLKISIFIALMVTVQLTDAVFTLLSEAVYWQESFNMIHVTIQALWLIYCDRLRFLKKI